MMPMYYHKKKTALIIGWVCVLPVFLIRLFAILYPTLCVVFYSLMDFSMIRQSFNFIGIQNYVAFFNNSTIRRTLEFTFIFIFVTVGLQIILGIALAQLLNIRAKWKKFLRSIVLIPWAIPIYVAGIAATWIFNKDYGLVNDILYRFGADQVSWFVHIWTARFAVIITDVWKGTPFFAILILAGLQQIDSEVYESARIDGAGWWSKFYRITLPNISQLIAVLAIFNLMKKISAFDLVYSMTAGGPGVATSLLSYQVYRVGFISLDFGFSSCIATTILIITAIFAVIGYAAQKKINN